MSVSGERLPTRFSGKLFAVYALGDKFHVFADDIEQALWLARKSHAVWEINHIEEIASTLLLYPKTLFDRIDRSETNSVGGKWSFEFEQTEFDKGVNW